MAAVRPVKKSLRPLGTMKLHKGQKLFCFNRLTTKISVVEFKDATYVPGDHRAGYFAPSLATGRAKVDLTLEENCLYAPAINEKNAMKKFILMLRKMRKK